MSVDSDRGIRNVGDDGSKDDRETLHRGQTYGMGARQASHVSFIQLSAIDVNEYADHEYRYPVYT